MRQLADEELIRKTLENSQGAFAELVRRYQRRVAVTVRSVVGEMPQEDLSDITQDIFLLAFRGLKSFRGEAQFGTWITRIALRHCYRESKRRRRRSGLFTRLIGRPGDRDAPEERLHGDLETDATIIGKETGSALTAAIAQLPEEFRTVLVLRVVEEMSVEEVAVALGISPGTVKSRLSRARDRVRELLQGTEIGEFGVEG